MLLVQEQFRNDRISEATTRHQLDGIQRMFAKIIKGMMDEGIVVKDDPKLLAVELTAPAVLQIARSDRQPQCAVSKSGPILILGVRTPTLIFLRETKIQPQTLLMD